MATERIGRLLLFVISAEVVLLPGIIILANTRPVLGNYEDFINNKTVASSNEAKGPETVLNNSSEIKCLETSLKNSREVKGPEAALKNSSEIKGLETALEISPETKGIETALKNSSEIRGLETALKNSREIKGLEITLQNSSEAKSSETALKSSNETKGPETSLKNSSQINGPEAALKNSNETKGPETSLKNSSEINGPEAAMKNATETKGPETSLKNSSEIKGPEADLKNSNETKGPETALYNSSEAKGLETTLMNSNETKGPETALYNSSEAKGLETTLLNSNETKGPETSLYNSSEAKGLETTLMNSNETKGQETALNNSSETKGLAIALKTRYDSYKRVVEKVSEAHNSDNPDHSKEEDISFQFSKACPENYSTTIAEESLGTRSNKFYDPNENSKRTSVETNLSYPELYEKTPPLPASSDFLEESPQKSCNPTSTTCLNYPEHSNETEKSAEYLDHDLKKSCETSGQTFENTSHTTGDSSNIVLAGITLERCHVSMCVNSCPHEPGPGHDYDNPKGPSSDRSDETEAVISTDTLCKDSTTRQCQCDQRCIVYGDCCPGVFERCFNLTETDQIESFINEIKQNYLRFDFSSPAALQQALKDKTQLGREDFIIDAYVAKYSNCASLNNMDYAKIIGECPENGQNKILRLKCEDKNAASPLLPFVTAKLKGVDVTFRNVYCAQCHSLEESILTAWSPKIHCFSLASLNDSHFRNVSDLETLLRTERCAVGFIKPTDVCQPRPCLLESQLPLTERETILENSKRGVCSPLDASLCDTYNFWKDAMKNPHCLKCLGLSSQQSNPLNSLCDPGRGGSYDVNPGILILLDITGRYTVDTEKSRTSLFYSCSEYEVFDPLTQKCKHLICPQGQEPYRGSCVKTSDAVLVENLSQIFPFGWYELEVSYTGIDYQKISCFAYSNEATKSTDFFSSDLVIILTVLHKDDFHFYNNRSILTPFIPPCYEIHVKAETENEENVITLKTILDLNLNVIHSFKNLAAWLAQWMGKKRKFVNSEITFTNMRQVDTSRGLCHQRGFPQRLQNFTLVQYNNSLYASVSSADTAIYYPFQSIGYEVTTSWAVANSVDISESVIVCAMREPRLLKKCLVVSYSLNETIQNGTGVIFPESGAYYRKGEFEIYGDVVLVCVKENRDFNRRNEMYAIISFVFTGVSMLFLLAMLLIYCVFPELCTVPGKMTASLAGAMLLTYLSNLMTFFQLRHEYICPVLAALSHVVTLAHFGWMAAIAVNMALTFGTCMSRSVQSSSNTRIFARYSIVVWGLSTAVVAVAVTLDLIHPHNTPSFHNATLTSANTSSSLSSTTSQLSNSRTFYPRYGTPLCTWFSGPMWTKLAFVFVPFSLTYITCLVGFIVTLYGIQSSSSCVKKLGSRSPHRTRCLIYMKLSTVMGFSWILSGFIAAFPHQPVLEYIYVTLVLSQGVLLFLAFMANKRVYFLILGKIKTTGKSNSQFTTSRNTRFTHETV